MTGDEHVLKVVVKVSRRVVPNGDAPGGFRGSFKGGAPNCWGYAVDRSVCLAGDRSGR